MTRRGTLTITQQGRLCSEAAALGLPDYFPRYMIQHGMAAFSPRNGDTGLAADFDAQQAMDWALGTYAHCPTAAG